MSSTSQNQSFDYSTLDNETRITVQVCTKTIQSHSLASVEKMIEVGKQLQIVKKKLKHGQFCSWLELELSMNSRQARRLMHVAKQIKVDKKDDSSFLSTLEISPSALYLLAEIKTPTSARDEAIDRAAVGETITLRVAKEIVSRHKEQDTHLSENLALPIVEIPNMLNDPAILGLQTEFLKTVSSQFCVGDRIRILRRQHGADKWTGCTAKIWEVTQNGWLRVDVEGHQGVRFTLKPEWVELMEKTEMTKIQDDNQPEVIQLEYKPSNALDTPETFVISSPSLTAEVKCTPNQMIAILGQIGITILNP